MSALEGIETGDEERYDLPLRPGLPERAIRSVAASLNHELDPAAALTIPQVERQSAQDAKRWSELYSARSRG
jgi:hypothetical protein